MVTVETRGDRKKLARAKVFEDRIKVAVCPKCNNWYLTTAERNAHRKKAHV